MRHRIAFAVCLSALLVPSVRAQEKEDPVHAELRTVRDDLINAVNNNDRDALIKQLHPNVTVTWMNGEVSRGPEEVKAYYDKMMSGPNKIVQTIQVYPKVDRLSDMYGDTALSYGSSDDHFKLTSGLEFDVHSRWSAVLVKHEGKWKVAQFQAGANLFDNPLLNAAKKTAIWASILAGVVGLGAGFLAARLLGRPTGGA